MRTYFYILSLLACITFTACQAKAKEENQSDAIAKAEIDLNKLPDKHNHNITYSGKVLGYNTDTSACFFVDQEMVKQNITDGFGDKAENGFCKNPKYGKGILVVFSELDLKSDYPTPPEQDILILIKGYWKNETYQGKENVPVLYVTEYQPFF